MTDVRASGQSAASSPSRAADGLTWTEWRSQCYICDPLEAWIEVRFSEPVMVFCVELWQWGKREYRTSGVLLQQWEAGSLGQAGEWISVMRGTGLDGDRWDTVRFTKCSDLEAPANGRLSISNGGYYPAEATFTCNGARLLGGSSTQQCLEDGSWPAASKRCWSLMEMIIAVTAFGTFEFVAFALYFYFVVSRKPGPLTVSSFIADENLGHWSTELGQGIEDKEGRAPLLWCLFCPCCRLAETWRGMGLVAFQLGGLIPQVCIAFLPCIGAWLRGNMRIRFNIEGTRSRDFLTWLCCMPCAAAQEARMQELMCELAAMEQAAMHADEERKRMREETNFGAVKPTEVGAIQDGKRGSRTSKASQEEERKGSKGSKESDGSKRKGSKGSRDSKGSKENEQDLKLAAAKAAVAKAEAKAKEAKAAAKASAQGHMSRRSVLELTNESELYHS